MDWMECGAEFIEDSGGREVVLEEIEKMEWHDLPCDDVPMMQGVAIKALLRDVVGGKPQAIAWGWGCLQGKYEILGIESWYRNGTYRHYWADRGTHLTPLLTEEV